MTSEHVLWNLWFFKNKLFSPNYAWILIMTFKDFYSAAYIAFIYQNYVTEYHKLLDSIYSLLSSLNQNWIEWMYSTWIHVRFPISFWYIILNVEKEWKSKSSLPAYIYSLMERNSLELLFLTQFLLFSIPHVF